MEKPHPHKLKECAELYFSQSGRREPTNRDALITSFTPLIKYIAGRLAARLPTHIALDDLISCGIIGLIDAIDKFDPAKEVLFKTYAEFRIKGAMLDELRSLDWVPRSVRRKIHELEEVYAEQEKRLGRPATDEEIALALHLDMEGFHRLLDETKAVTFMDIDLLHQEAALPKEASLADSLFQDDQEDPFTKISLTEFRTKVAQAIGSLPEKEKLTVSLYYAEEMTMKEIGQVLGYTESRISQMHSKAMLRLRARLRREIES